MCHTLLLWICRLSVGIFWWWSGQILSDLLALTAAWSKFYSASKQQQDLSVHTYGYQIYFHRCNKIYISFIPCLPNWLVQYVPFSLIHHYDVSSSLTNYIALNLQACIALHWHNIYEGYLCKICLIYSLRLLLYVMRCLLLQQTKKKAGHLQSREEEGAFCYSGMSSWAHHLLSGDIWFLDWSTHLSFIHLFLQLLQVSY